MSRSYRTQGVILKRISFGEADRLLTVFTDKHGKLKIVAKGVRRLNSRKKGHLELFCQSRIFLAKGKNLDLVTEAETIDTFPKLRKNLNRVKIAYLFCELVDQLTAENQSHPQVYELLVNNLQALNSDTAPKDLIIDFEKQLLQILGFGLPRQTSRQALESHIISITDRPLKSLKLTDRNF